MAYQSSPDISGWIDVGANNALAATSGESGCFSNATSGDAASFTVQKQERIPHGISFSANRANPAFGKSETTQMASLRLLAIIKW